MQVRQTSVPAQKGEEFVEQLLSRVSRQLVEHVAGRVSKRRTETENLSEFLFGEERDSRRGRLTRSPSPRNRGACSKRRLSSVTRTEISPAPRSAEPREPQAGSAFGAALAASPAADNLRKSRLVCSVDILPPNNMCGYSRPRISCLSTPL
jgi:hypothetical protein